MMLGTNYFIIESKDNYENKRGKLIENIDRDQAFYIKRQGKLVAAPEDYKYIPEGSELIFHHNILRKKGDIKGKEILSSFHIKDDLYYVPVTEAFGYIHEGRIFTINDNNFVKPIKDTNNDLSYDEFMQESYKGNVKNQGVLVVPSEALRNKVGQTLIFSDYSEYEFYIQGELYYKMRDRDILAFIN